MKGVIYYYSGSGNTKLACQYLARQIHGIEFEFVDVTEVNKPDLDACDIAGFATFTDFFAPPHRFQMFLKELPRQEGKPAFVFNTYGSFSGKTLTTLESLATDKGFNVIAGHLLHTPESYPPLIALGITNQDAPGEDELKAFDQFIERLAAKIRVLQAGGQVEADGIHLGLLNRLIPALPRTASRKLMGEKHVDAARCTTCGLCVKVCPYNAVKLEGEIPVFDEQKCYGCWACYNHCPERAIYTKRYKDVGHYPQPNSQVRQKLH